MAMADSTSAWRRLTARCGWCQVDFESSIAIEQSWIRAIQLQPLFINQEHRNPRSVLAVIENLFRFVVLGLESVNFGGAVGAGFPGRQIIAEHARRIVE